jgi:hypothetical protein
VMVAWFHGTDVVDREALTGLGNKPLKLFGG